MQPLFSSSIVMVVAKNNPLAQLKSVNLKQLAELELILPGKGFSSRTFINELFYKHKMSPNIKIELNDVHTLLSLVQDGDWATILNEKTIIGWDRLAAIPIAGQEVKKQSYILWQKGVYRKKAAILFTEQLMETMNNE